MFSDLPKEIQREILLQNPESLSSTYLLNKNLYHTMRIDYLRYQCEKPISSFEMAQYLNMNPGAFYVSKDGFDMHNLYKYEFFLLINNGSNYDFIQTLVTDNIRHFTIFQHDYTYMKAEIDKETIKFSGATYNIEEYQPDLLTMYQILMNRTQCTALDAYFSKKRILAILKDKYDTLNNTIFDILVLYTYLSLNIAIITNNYQDFKSNRYIDDISNNPNDGNLQQIKQSIQELYELLRAHILEL